MGGSKRFWLPIILATLVVAALMLAVALSIFKSVLVAGVLLAIFLVSLLAVQLKDFPFVSTVLRRYNTNDARKGITPGQFFRCVVVPVQLAAFFAAWSFTTGPGTNAARPSLDRSADGFVLRSPAFIRGLHSSAEAAADHDQDGVLLPYLLNYLGPDGDTVESWASDHIPWLTAARFCIAFGLFGCVSHLLALILSRSNQVSLAVGEFQAPTDDGLGSRLLPKKLRETWALSPDEVYLVACATVAGVTGGLLFVTMISQVLWPLRDYPAAVATVGPPLAVLVLVVALYIEVWLTRTSIPSWRRARPWPPGPSRSTPTGRPHDSSSTPWPRCSRL